MARVPSNVRRRVISLLAAFTFLVMAVSGVLAFFRPFSIKLIGLHSLMGFVFIVLVCAHVTNNGRNLKGYLRSRVVWGVVIFSATLTLLFFVQPTPVKAILGLSKNLGPALDRFEMTGEGMIYHYRPSENYEMKLMVEAGPAYDLENPPRVAIWLENQGGYHLKTLHQPTDGEENLPYWKFKRDGWQKAREDAEKNPKPDAVSSPTPNGSFDPADYILPADPETSTPYQMLIEVNEPGHSNGDADDQASLVYAVEIDNLDPRTFQLLDLVGHPRRDEDGQGWSLFYVDDGLGSALQLIDSALLVIHRDSGGGAR